MQHNKNSEIKLHLEIKAPKQFSNKREAFSTNGGYSYKKVTFNLYLTLYIKIIHRWVIGLNMKRGENWFLA